LPSRGRYIGCIPSLHFVPQPVQHVQAGRPHVDTSVIGDLLDPLEALPELPIGPVECGAGLNPCLSGQVDDGKEQIADLLDQRVTGRLPRCIRVRIGPLMARRLGAKFLLDFGELLADFLDRARDIGPVEPNRRRTLLQAKGHQQLRESWDQPRQHVPLPFATLDFLPGLGLAEIE
jgi:hypothetical protein